MPQYTKDGDGVVHVMDINSPGSEFTFCNRATDGEDTFRGEYLGGFTAQTSNGPSNCPDCKVAVERTRESIKGVRFTA